MTLTDNLKGKRFVRISPITGACTEGVVKDVLCSFTAGEDKALKVHVHLRSTNGVVYDLADCRILADTALRIQLGAIGKFVRLKPQERKS